MSLHSLEGFNLFCSPLLTLTDTEACCTHSSWLCLCPAAALESMFLIRTFSSSVARKAYPLPGKGGPHVTRPPASHSVARCASWSYPPAPLLFSRCRVCCSFSSPFLPDTPSSPLTVFIVPAGLSVPSYALPTLLLLATESSASPAGLSNPHLPLRQLPLHSLSAPSDGACGLTCPLSPGQKGLFVSEVNKLLLNFHYTHLHLFYTCGFTF